MYICTYILIPLASLQDQSELRTDAVSTSVVVADAVEAGPKKQGGWAHFLQDLFARVLNYERNNGSKFFFIHAFHFARRQSLLMPGE